MAANTKPIFTKTPRSGMSDAVLSAQNTSLDLTSGTIYLLATAGVDACLISRLFLQPLGTNTASVIRLWVNNGGVTSAAGNNRWFLDITLPATTTSIVASIPAIIAELNLHLEAGFRLYATLGTAVAAGYHGMAEFGDY